MSERHESYLKSVLETALDAFGAEKVLTVISELCAERSEHIAENAALSQRWTDLAMEVGLVAKTSEGL